MLPTSCVTVSLNFSQIDISVIEINSVLGIGVSLSIYPYTYHYIYKSCPNKFLVGLKFWTSWGPGYKNSKSPSRMDFFKIILKVDLKISRYMRGLFMKKISICIFFCFFSFTRNFLKKAKSLTLILRDQYFLLLIDK